MAKKGFSFSKTAVWALMALLILGLGGFGAINLSGNLRSIGSVGDKSISVDQYARQLQQEIRAIEAQTGESLSFARAQEMGLDRAVLQRIVRNRALDHDLPVHQRNQVRIDCAEGTIAAQFEEFLGWQRVQLVFGNGPIVSDLLLLANRIALIVARLEGNRLLLQQIHNHRLRAGQP